MFECLISSPCRYHWGSAWTQDTTWRCVIEGSRRTIYWSCADDMRTYQAKRYSGKFIFWDFKMDSKVGLGAKRDVLNKRPIIQPLRNNTNSIEEEKTLIPSNHILPKKNVSTILCFFNSFLELMTQWIKIYPFCLNWGAEVILKLSIFLFSWAITSTISRHFTTAFLIFFINVQTSWLKNHTKRFSLEVRLSHIVCQWLECAITNATSLALISYVIIKKQ